MAFQSLVRLKVEEELIVMLTGAWSNHVMVLMECTAIPICLLNNSLFGSRSCGGQKKSYSLSLSYDDIAKHCVGHGCIGSSLGHR